MDAFIEFGERRFKLFTNIVFYLAILIISGQIIETGFTSEQLQLFNRLYKPLNLAFSFLAAGMSFYLYLSRKTSFFPDVCFIPHYCYSMDT